MINIASFSRCLLLTVLLSAFTVLSAADYKILLAPDAKPAEKTAAAEMQLFAGQLLGKNVPIVNKADGSGKYIRIGATEDAEKVLQVKFASLQPDELLIRSVNGDIYLAGGGTRGTLYAVYEYLERFCGVRFLTPKVNHIPALKTPGVLPDADYRFLSKNRIRVISMYKKTPEDKIFAARRRLNGSYNHMIPLTAEFGGQEYFLGCHSFQRFCPPNRAALAKNPEFYAMIDGKRVHDAQLCMSNLKLREHVAAEVKKWIKDRPDVTRVSVSMNDYKRFCQCPECVNWIRSRNAEISDLLVDFVNDVAARLEPDFPDLEVVTLAYLDARKPPKVSKPRKNVGVLYCFIELDTSKPMTHKKNAWMLEELAQWQKSGAKIYTWLYTINEKISILVQPNLAALDSDIRTLAALDSEFVFCEFSYPEKYFTDFIRMRFYIMSALLWNQDKTLDELIEEFCTAYYGAAAPEIIAALKIIVKAPEEVQGRMVCNFASSVIHAYGHDKFLAAWQRMQNARKIAAASGDPAIQNRVELAVISYDLTLLHDCFDLRNNLPEALKGFDPVALFDRDMKILKANGITNYFIPKNFTFDNYREKIIRLWGHNDGELPEGIDAVPGTLIWDAEKISNQSRRGKITVADDPEAHGGKAMQVVFNGKKLVRLEIDNGLRGKYRIYLTVKAELSGKPKGAVMTGNVWESASRWVRRAKPMYLTLSENSGSGYQVYLLGEAVFKTSYDLQLPIADDPAIRNLYIDRIIMVPVK